MALFLGLFFAVLFSVLQGLLCMQISMHGNTEICIWKLLADPATGARGLVYQAGSTRLRASHEGVKPGYL
jgi:hypothetical protein